ncbi:MAG: hypothetical protein ACXVCP_15175 [Bdellovibrio sp.]
MSKFILMSFIFGISVSSAVSNACSPEEAMAAANAQGKELKEMSGGRIFLSAPIENNGIYSFYLALLNPENRPKDLALMGAGFINVSADNCKTDWFLSGAEEVK